MSTLLTRPTDPTHEGLHRPRLLALDGLRGIAILLVLLHHSAPFGWGIADIGWAGVDLFFVLSGFLITGILLNTVHSPHYYRNFISRRTLRIFPLYYFALAIFTVAGSMSAKWQDFQSWGGVGWFVFYIGNIHTAWMRSDPPMFSFATLWSLQVEEQFYLAYPALVAFLSPANLRRVLIGCVFGALFLRILLLIFVPDSGPMSYILTPCRMDSLAMGGLVAILTRTQPNRFTLNQMLTALACSIALLMAICAVSGPSSSTPLMSTIGLTLTAATASLLLMIILDCSKSRFSVMMEWKPLVYTGQIAYGLYLLHPAAAWVGRLLIGRLTGATIQGHSTLSIPITLITSYIAAGISWRFMESPILRLKDRFTR